MLFWSEPWSREVSVSGLWKAVGLGGPRRNLNLVWAAHIGWSQLKGVPGGKGDPWVWSGTGTRKTSIIGGCLPYLAELNTCPQADFFHLWGEVKIAHLCTVRRAYRSVLMIAEWLDMLTTCVNP